MVKRKRLSVEDTEKEPICLECEYLVWQGFYAVCGLLIERFLTSGNDELFDEWAELVPFVLPPKGFLIPTQNEKEKEKVQKKIAVIETQMDLDMEKRIEDKLITAFPYVVWKRKNIIKYHENAPKTWKDCPFRIRE